MTPFGNLSRFMAAMLAWIVLMADTGNAQDSDSRWVYKTIRQQYRSCDWAGECSDRWRWRNVRVPAIRYYAAPRYDDIRRDLPPGGLDNQPLAMARRVVRRELAGELVAQVRDDAVVKIRPNCRMLQPGIHAGKSVTAVLAHAEIIAFAKAT